MNKLCFFVATYEAFIMTKVEITLPYDIIDWHSAVNYAVSRQPDGYFFSGLRFCSILCDNQETQKEKEISAE
mgnify:CR=1 FL=1